MSDEGEHFNNGFAVGLKEAAGRLGELMSPEASARYRAVDLAAVFHRDQRKYEDSVTPEKLIETAKLIESYLLGK